MTIEKTGCKNKHEIFREIFQTKKKTNKKDMHEINDKYVQKKQTKTKRIWEKYIAM